MGSPEALGKGSGNWVITAGHEMFHVFQAANEATRKQRRWRLALRTRHRGNLLSHFRTVMLTSCG